MAFGRLKKFAGGIGAVVTDLTGSKALGRGAAMMVGSATGAIGGGAIGGPVGALAGAGAGVAAGSSGYSSVSRAKTNAENAIIKAQELQNVEAIKNQQIADKNQQIAEEQRQKTLLQADIQEQLLQERKRTTFAGTSIQGITERKKLLGV